MKDYQDIKRILQRVKENTRTESISIKTRISSGRLPLTCSKFGGVPYWPDNRDYPKTDTGIPLTMLAQIDLSDVPENSLLPDKGLLQFFVWNLEDWDNYRVVYHKDCGAPVSPHLDTFPTSLVPKTAGDPGKRFTAPDTFWGENGLFPITGEMSLEFSKKYEPANVTENCFESEFIKAAEQLGIHIPDGFDVYDCLPDELYDEFYDYGGGHKLLGRPCFVQYDYREGESKDDILLFQIDSTWPDSGETDSDHFINFGIDGTAGFFIKKDDLRKLDFSHVYYDWACG